MKQLLTCLVLLSLLTFSTVAAKAQCSIGLNVTPGSSPTEYIIETSLTNYPDTSLLEVSISSAGFYPPVMNSDSFAFNFPGNGTYVICNYATTSTSCADSTCTILTITGAPTWNCSSVAYATPLGQGYYNLYVFSSAPSSWITIFQWSFGATGNSVFYQFNANGNHYVLYTVTSYNPADPTQNCTFMDTLFVNVTNAPSCNITSSANVNNFPTSINQYDRMLNGGYSNHNSSIPIIHKWTVNGTPVASVKDYLYNFGGPGVYNVCYIVSQIKNGSVFCSDTTCQTVTISQLCNAYFSVWPDTTNPSTYFGVNLSTGNNLTYLWNFGDGNTSTLQYPTHTYASAGSYTVCLTVTDIVTQCTSIWCDSLGFQRMASGMEQLNIIDPSTVGIGDELQETEVSLMPNPVNASPVLTINTIKNSQLSMMIYSVTGQVVAKRRLNVTAGENTYSIDTGELAPGVYLLQLSDRNGPVKTIRMIK